ncbi:MAG: hypothetical protein Q8P41_10440, partial [Pseudomonadota bacterium]|nr:hypothetical protein [Pseudomonadota bacterium]
MAPLRATAALLALALCGAEARLLTRSARPGVVVTAVDTTVAPPVASAVGTLEPAFLAHMTADDVARGVYALAAAEGAVALTTDQKAAIAPALREGAEL